MTQVNSKICALLIFISTIVGCSTLKTDPTIDQQLSELLENKNFFKLQTELENAKSKLSEDRWLYYQAHCNNVFDRCEESNKNIETLLDKHGKSISDSIKKDLFEIKASNYIRSYKYKDAANAYGKIISEYGSIVDSADNEDYVNSQKLFATLAEVKPQLMHKHNDMLIEGYRNQFNLLMVPVKSGGLDCEFVFDTGANLSTITQSYAEKMGMTIYQSDISVGTSTHAKIQTKLAAADSLYVGGLLFENVVFLVVTDESMNFPSINFEIKGIIGFPVMHQMEEVHIRKDGSIFIPQKPKNRQLANMYLDNLNPIVQVVSSADTLIFQLDTGAVSSELSKQYFDNNKEQVENNGELVKHSRGGGGGVFEVEEYQLKNFPFNLGSKSGVLTEISVNTADFDFLKKFDGNLGQDVIMQFDELILNFTHMYLDFN